MDWFIRSEELEVKFDSGKSVKGPAPFLFDEEGHKIRRIGSMGNQVFVTFEMAGQGNLLKKFAFTISSSVCEGSFSIEISEFARGMYLDK